MNKEELRQHENDMIAHFTNAVPDGCVCGMCEAVLEVARDLEKEPQS